jgi:8-amino-7-oxononanoate synthase
MSDSLIVESSSRAGPASKLQPSQSWNDHFRHQLNELQEKRLLRIRGSSGLRGADSEAHHPTDGSGQLDFGSNDYLGLKNHPSILEAVRNAIQHDPWGSGASPVLSGYREAHAQLERSLAGLFHAESCLLFSSGYACNVGVLSALSDSETVVFSDRLNHASLIDGIRLGRGPRFIYGHCDLQHLHDLIRLHRGERRRALIVTESVFSMDGDEAPLEALAEIAIESDCGLVVDEAHAVGVFGDGAGLVHEVGIPARVLVKLGTLSKALGGIGGYAAGSNLAIETLVNRCRSYLFSTAPPAAAMAAAQAAVELLPRMADERKHLANLAAMARRTLREQGWQVPEGRSPIVPVIIGDPQATLDLSRHLLEKGIYAPAIRPPTVPPETSRLRLSLSASHSTSDIYQLCQTIGSRSQ